MIEQFQETSPVNSYTEWMPLKEVIIGNWFSPFIADLDISFKLFYHDLVYKLLAYGKPGAFTIPKRYVEETQEDIKNFIDVLHSLGINTKRPLIRETQDVVKTPYWEAACSPPINIRDQTLILGNEIIETPPMVRSRYFENDLLKPLFYRYFLGGAKWTVAPRPMMTDKSYDYSYVFREAIDSGDLGVIEKAEDFYSGQASDFDYGVEIMFDAAQCLRFGKDIIINVSTKNHNLGAEWLKRHTDGKFNIHKVYITDNHIDSSIMPLRAGTLLVNPEWVKDLTSLPKGLKKWDIIYAPELTEDMYPEYEGTVLQVASRFLDINVLPIDGNHIIVSKRYKSLIKVLEKHGFTPIPLELRHGRIFGGGFHCITLDVCRDEHLESYFD